MARIRLISVAAEVLALTALAGCGQSAGGERSEPTGQLVAKIAASAATDDVASVQFKVVLDTETCDAAGLAMAIAPLEQESIPQGGGMHSFSDHLFVLPPGTYRICATPLQADGTPSEVCSPTDGLSTVMSGVTTETTLVSQCSGTGNGGSDTIVVFNHPPLITDLVISESKFILVCESADLTVTASDPDGDTITATWSIESQPAGSMAAQLVASGLTARFTPDVVGDYTLRVTIDDSLGGSASLTFPIHVSAGDCAAPDAAVPPPDAAVPPPDAEVPPPDAAVPPPDAEVPPPDAEVLPPDAAVPPPDAPAGVDISGTFISRVVTMGTITVPLISNQPATIDIILRIVVNQSGGNIANHLEICRLNTQTEGGSLVVNFPPAVLSLLTDDETVPDPTLTIGGPVPLPTFNIRVGQDAAGMPVDSDGDGNPGVTIPTVLLGSAIQAYSGLDIALSFPTATLTDANTINGDSAFSTTGTVFNTVPLGLMGPIMVTPSNPTTPFMSARLAGDVPCSEVVTMFP